MEAVLVAWATELNTVAFRVSTTDIYFLTALEAGKSEIKFPAKFFLKSSLFSSVA